MGYQLEEITSVADFEAKMNAAPVVVIEVIAKWAGPCKIFEVDLYNLSKNFDASKVRFFKLDVESSFIDELPRTCSAHVLPKTIVFCKGEEQDHTEGAHYKNPGLLRNTIEFCLERYCS